jgi:prenyltransferase beta subunit
LAFHRAAHQILADVADAQLELMGGFGHCPQVEAPSDSPSCCLSSAQGFRWSRRSGEVAAGWRWSRR